MGEPENLSHILADAGGHVPVGLRGDESVLPLAAGTRVNHNVGLAGGSGRTLGKIFAPAAGKRV